MTVHNLHFETMGPDDIRIDRRSEYGNEFKIGPDGDRAEVIAKFEMAERARIASDPVRREKIKQMHGKRLFCWCRPRPCHGDVYERQRLN